MKKPTPGQLSLGFFAAVAFCFFAAFLIPALNLFLEIIVWPSLFLAVFFLAVVLAWQVKDRGQSPIAIIILVSGFLVWAVPAFLIVIGSFSPPTPDSLTPTDLFQEIADVLEILRFYGAGVLVFFSSVIAGLLVNNKKLSKPGQILTKLSFLAVAISLLFNLALIFGLVSFLGNIQAALGLMFLTLLLTAVTGIFRLEARKDPVAKSSISFDKDEPTKKSPSATIPPPIAQQKVVGPKPVNQDKPASLPIQPEPASDPVKPLNQSEPDYQVPVEENQAELTEKKSPFAEKLTELSNPVFKEIRTEPSQPSSSQEIKPGWYQDPSDQGFIRYWDGDAWTSHRQSKQ
jgi:hypothetical protein